MSPPLLGDDQDPLLDAVDALLGQPRLPRPASDPTPPPAPVALPPVTVGSNPLVEEVDRLLGGTMSGRPTTKLPTVTLDPTYGGDIPLSPEIGVMEAGARRSGRLAGMAPNIKPPQAPPADFDVPAYIQAIESGIFGPAATMALTGDVGTLARSTAGSFVAPQIELAGAVGHGASEITNALYGRHDPSMAMLGTDEAIADVGGRDATMPTIDKDGAAALADPRWWANAAGQGIGSTMSLALASLSGGGTKAMVVGEAAAEALGVYNSRLRENGGNVLDASARAAAVFAANAALLGVSTAAVLNPEAKSAIGRFGLAALTEGGQEGVQTTISNVAEERPWYEGMGEAIAAGGVGGVALHGVMGEGAPEEEPDPLLKAVDLTLNTTPPAVVDLPLHGGPEAPHTAGGNDFSQRPAAPGPTPAVDPATMGPVPTNLPLYPPPGAPQTQATRVPVGDFRPKVAPPVPVAAPPEVAPETAGSLPPTPLGAPVLPPPPVPPMEPLPETVAPPEVPPSPVVQAPAGVPPRVPVGDFRPKVAPPVPVAAPAAPAVRPHEELTDEQLAAELLAELAGQRAPAAAPSTTPTPPQVRVDQTPTGNKPAPPVAVEGDVAPESSRLPEGTRVTGSFGEGTVDSYQTDKQGQVRILVRLPDRPGSSLLPYRSVAPEDITVVPSTPAAPSAPTGRAPVGQFRPKQAAAAPAAPRSDKAFIVPTRQGYIAVPQGKELVPEGTPPAPLSKEAARDLRLKIDDIDAQSRDGLLPPAPAGENKWMRAMRDALTDEELHHAVTEGKLAPAMAEKIRAMPVKGQARPATAGDLVGTKPTTFLDMTPGESVTGEATWGGTLDAATFVRYKDAMTAIVEVEGQEVEAKADTLRRLAPAGAPAAGAPGKPQRKPKPPVPPKAEAAPDKPPKGKTLSPEAQARVARAKAAREKFASANAEAKAEYDAARAEVRGKLGKTSSGVDPTIAVSMVKVVRAMVKGGLTDAGVAWTQWVVDNNGDLSDADWRDLFRLLWKRVTGGDVDTRVIDEAHEDALALIAEQDQTSAEDPDDVDDDADTTETGVAAGEPDARSGVEPAEPGAVRPGDGGSAPASEGSVPEPDRGGVPGPRGDGSDRGRVDAPDGDTGQSAGTGQPAGKPAGKPRKPKPAAPEVSHTNFVATSATDLGEDATPAVRVRHQLDAIRLLKDLEASGAQATPEQQTVLAKFTGWGHPALTDLFGRQRDSAAGKELQALLTKEEYKAAERATTNAQYTSFDIIQALWQIAKQLGVGQGRALEPSMGTGAIVASAPSNLAWTGVEMDSLTAGIAMQLYPQADVQHAPFQQAFTPEGYFDVVVGNVPFGSWQVHDPTGDKTRPSNALIHNYFVMRSLEKLRPGGISILITADGTLDSKGRAHRDWLAKHANFVGAIRLPRQAFKTSGTEVVTDILVFQKHGEGVTPLDDQSWLDTVTQTYGSWSGPINSWIVAHPEAVVGTPDDTGRLLGGPQYSVNFTGDSLPKALTTAIRKVLPKDIATVATATDLANQQTLDQVLPAADDMRPGNYAVKDGRIYIHDGRGLVPVKDLSALITARLKLLLPIRDGVRELLRAEAAGEDEDALQARRDDLAAKYDAYVAVHGPMHGRKTGEAIGEDPDYARWLMLEEYDKEHGTATKSRIFRERMLPRRDPPTSAASPADALAYSLQERGRIDLPYMLGLLGDAYGSEGEVTAALKGVIYENPEGRQWETAEEYLSGNVVHKLEVARKLATKRTHPSDIIHDNIAALEQVQPEPVRPVDIHVEFGSRWVPLDLYHEFIGRELGNRWTMDKQVRRHEQTGTWLLSIRGGDNSRWVNAQAEFSASWLFTRVLEGRDLTVRNRIPGSDPAQYVVNEAATEDARAKAAELQEAWHAFLFQEDADRTEAVAALYNRQFNNLAPRKYNGDHLVLPGLTPSITLRPHQRQAIWRVITEGRALLAHVVGAGKTFEMIAAIMESRRLGKFKRPMMTVPNHLVESTAREFARLYPASNTLVIPAGGLNAKNRAKWLARIHSGNYDAIIVPFSVYSRIAIRPTVLQQHIDNLAEEHEAIVEAEAEAAGKKSPSVKQLQKRLEAMRKKLETKKAALEKNADKVGLWWDELGIDMLVADEAHGFKNLFFGTTMGHVGNVTTSDAMRAFDMSFKVQDVQGRNGGTRGVVFATGTPVTNTLSEAWIMLRYLAPDLLRERGVYEFDSFARHFGVMEEVYEPQAEGSGYRSKVRLTKFTNLPELKQLFRAVADVVTHADVKLPVPTIRTGAPQPVTAPATSTMARIMKMLLKRGEAVRGRRVDPSEDNMLAIGTDGRMAAVDPRLLDDYPDEPDSKINTAVEQITRLYKATAKKRGTQLLFLDVGVPHGKGKKAAAAEEADTVDSDVTKEQTGRIDLYADIKRKLLDNGVLENEIAFIHDANTDDKKLTLFGKVRRGEVRILLGSTEKMGTGMNVQDRLVAVHHLDVPYRPADLEQRNGRIIRQGNVFATVDSPEYDPSFEIDIFNYIAAASFDERNWDVIARKARGIAAFMSGDLSLREMEDEDATAMSADEFKAWAANDPRVSKLVKDEKDLRRLKLKRQSWQADKLALKQKVAQYTREVAWYDTVLREVAEVEDAHGIPAIKGPETFTISVEGEKWSHREGQTFTDPETFATWMAEKRQGYGELRGRYGSLDWTLTYTQHGMEFRVGLSKVNAPGAYIGGVHPEGLNVTLNATTPDGWASGLPRAVTRIKEKAADLETNRKKAQFSLDKAQGNVDRHGEENPHDVKAAETAIDELRRQIDEAAAAKAEKEDEDGDGYTSGVGSGGDITGVFENGVWTEGDPQRRTLGMAQPSQSGRPATLPLPAAPTTARASKLNPTVTPSAIIERLRKGLRNRPYNVGRIAERALGIFKIKPEVIRTRIANDLQVFFHEAGHLVDESILKIDRSDIRWSAELLAMGQPTSRPSYTKDQQRQEGAAEFMRLFLTEPQVARQQAPNYTAEFVRRLGEHPDIAAVLQREQQHVAELIGLSEGDRARLKVSFTPQAPDVVQDLREDPKGTVRGWARQMRTAWADTLGRVADASDGPAYRMIRLLAGTGSKAWTMLEGDGVRDPNTGALLAPSMKKIMRGAPSDAQEFSRYLAARRAVHLNAQGRMSGMTDAGAQQIIDHVDRLPDAKQYKDTATALYEFQNALLDYGVAAGVFSQQQVDKMRMDNPDYVPFQRVRTAKERRGLKRGVIDLRSPIHALKGSNLDIIDPIESIYGNTHLLLSFIDRTAAFNQLADEVTDRQGGGNLLERIPPSRVKKVVGVADVLSQAFKDQQRENAQAGMSQSDMDDAADLMTDAISTLLDQMGDDARVALWSQIVTPDADERIAVTLRGGVLQAFQVNDAELYDALRLWKPGTWNNKLAELVIKGPARLLRATATLTPRFIARNPLRDMFTAQIQSEHGHILGVDFIKGLFSVLGHDQYYEGFLRSGAGESMLVSGDRRDVRKKMVAMAKHRNKYKKFVLSYALHPIDALRALAELTESATRVGEFRLIMDAGGVPRTIVQRALGQGLAPRATRQHFRKTGEIDADILERAGYGAREVTQDFSKGGKWSRTLNQVLPFYNAMVGGNVKAAETLAREWKHPISLTIKFLPLLLLEAAVSALNGDDEWYWSQPYWQRSVFYHIPLPGDRYVLIPRAHVYGQLAHIPFAIFDYLHGQGERAYEQFVPDKDTATSLLTEHIPQSVLPVLETFFNYDTFRRRPLLSPYSVNLANELRYTAWTSETAKALAPSMGLAPAQLDHLIHGYMSGLSTFGMEYIADPLTELATGGSGKPPAPTKLLRQHPLMGAFLSEKTKLTGSSAEYLNTFQKEFVQFQAAVTASNRGMSPEKLREEYAGSVFLDKAGQARFREADRRLDSLGRTVRGIYEDPDMPPDEKAAKRDAVYEEMEDTARWALGAPRLPRTRPQVRSSSKGGKVTYAPLPLQVR